MTQKDVSPLAPRYRSQLAVHGVWASVAGMLGGLGFLFNILRYIEVFPFVPRIEAKVPGSEPAWRAAHTGPIMNGMLAMSVASVGSMVELSPKAQRGLVVTMLITIWGNTIGYNAAAVGGERGLTHRGGPLNNVAYVSFLAAAGSVLVSLGLTLVGLGRHRRSVTR